MCSTSVDPSPSTIRSPWRRSHSANISCDSVSAAERQSRKLERSRRSDPGCTIRALYKVGNPKKRVGRCRSITPYTASGSGAPRVEHRGRADRKREGDRVAESVGEEDLRRREHDVGLADAQHPLAIRLVRVGSVVVQMDNAFRPTRAARAVHPERHLVGMRVGLGEFCACSGGPGVPSRHLHQFEWRHRAVSNHDQVSQPARAHIRVIQQIGERVVHDRRLRPAVAEVVRDKLRRGERVDEHGDKAGPHRAEDGGDILGRIEHHQQHAAAAREAHRGEAVSDPAGKIAEVRVGECAVLADNGCLAPRPAARLSNRMRAAL